MKKQIFNYAWYYWVNPLIFFSVLTLAGCTSLLKANFNEDTVGSPPVKSLPGSPSGDRIQYETVLEPRLEVVNHSGFSTKALAHKFVSLGPDVPSQDRWAHFRAKSTDLTKTITYTWVGIADFTNISGTLTIYLEDGAGHLFAIVKIERDGTLMVADDAANYSTAGTIAPGQSHTFMVSVDVANERYNLSVLKSGGNITVENHPLFYDNILVYANPAHPTASFQFPEGGGFNHAYLIDEIYISKGNN